MPALGPAAALPLAADASVDVAACVLLLCFLSWGVFRGALRQFLGFALLAVAFPAATAATPHVEGTLSKVMSLAPADLTCAAWLVVFVGTLAAGGVVLHLFHMPLSRVRVGGKADTWMAGVTGLAKGVVVAAVLGYGILGAYADDARPPQVVLSVRESRAARGLVDVEKVVRPLLRLPAPVADRVSRVNRSVEPPSRAASATP